MKYWVYLNNNVLGPYDKNEVLKMEGFTTETMLTPEVGPGAENQEWKPASEYPEFSQAGQTSAPAAETPQPAAETPQQTAAPEAASPNEISLSSVSGQPAAEASAFPAIEPAQSAGPISIEPIMPEASPAPQAEEPAFAMPQQETAQQAESFPPVESFTPQAQTPEAAPESFSFAEPQAEQPAETPADPLSQIEPVAVEETPQAAMPAVSAIDPISLSSIAQTVNVPTPQEQLAEEHNLMQQTQTQSQMGTVGPVLEHNIEKLEQSIRNLVTVIETIPKNQQPPSDTQTMPAQPAAPSPEMLKLLEDIRSILMQQLNVSQELLAKMAVPGAMPAAAPASAWPPPSSDSQMQMPVQQMASAPISLTAPADKSATIALGSEPSVYEEKVSFGQRIGRMIQAITRFFLWTIVVIVLLGILAFSLKKQHMLPAGLDPFKMLSSKKTQTEEPMQTTSTDTVKASGTEQNEDGILAEVKAYEVTPGITLETLLAASLKPEDAQNLEWKVQPTGEDLYSVSAKIPLSTQDARDRQSYRFDYDAKEKTLTPFDFSAKKLFADAKDAAQKPSKSAKQKKGKDKKPAKKAAKSSDMGEEISQPMDE